MFRLVSNSFGYTRLSDGHDYSLFKLTEAISQVTFSGPVPCLSLQHLASLGSILVSKPLALSHNHISNIDLTINKIIRIVLFGVFLTIKLRSVIK